MKFNTVHFVATENLSYTKYPKIYALEAHYGMELGNSYTNETAGKEMS